MWFVWELVLQMAGEALIELGLTSTNEAFERRARAHPIVAGIGALLLGARGGVLTSLIWPTRLFRPGPVPGISLILSPLVSGIAMNWYGEWREGRGWPRSFMATFWGGVLFAFGMAGVRFLWVTNS